MLSEKKLIEQLNKCKFENKNLIEKLDRIENEKQQSRKQKVKWSIKVASWWGGKDLKHSTIDLINAQNKTTIGNFLGSLADRLTRLTIFGIAISLIPFTILITQAVLLHVQNKKIENQNDKIKQQVYLEEASRRNNLVLLMDNILEKVNDELKNGDGKLNKPLISRISALSQGFQPYYFLKDSTLTETQYSPERGQLLLALADSGVDTTTLNKIYSRTTFENAYLAGADMDSFYLKKIRLMGSDLTNAKLIKTNLIDANLRGADLSDAYLSGTKLIKTNLSGANLSNAHLSGANLNGSDLSGTNLNGADLMGANLSNVDLDYANLSNTILAYTNLAGADLIKANLNKSDLNGANLNFTRVSESNWFEKLKDWEVKGYNTLQTKYKIESSGDTDLNGNLIYELKLKN